MQGDLTNPDIALSQCHRNSCRNASFTNLFWRQSLTVRTSDKDQTLTHSNGKTCSSNQSSIYEALFKEKFAAHDAKEDVQALQRILFLSPIRITEQDIITHCKPISSCDALLDCRYLDKRYELLHTMKSKLYNELRPNQAPTTKSMAVKIAGSGSRVIS